MIDFRFFWNRIVDLTFLVDMVLVFFTPFQDVHEAWVYDYKRIAKRYIYGQAFPDFISIVPFDVISMVRSRHYLHGKNEILIMFCI